MEPLKHKAVHVEPEVLSPASIISPQILLVVSLLLVVVLLATFAILSRRKSTLRGDSVLLVGSSDAGKTAILSTLLYNQTLPTHTSMQANSSVVPLTTGTLRVVDIPGHPRIRDQFREHLSDARGVAFVVDSGTISRNGAAVAENLHQVLHAITSLPPSRPTPALLIVAHKYDLLKPTAQATPDQLAINRVRTILERELEKRRASQAGGVGVEGLGAEGTESELGGLECSGTGEFRFADWEGGEVDFVGTSVGKATLSDEKTDGHDGLSPLRSWLNEQL